MLPILPGLLFLSIHVLKSDDISLVENLTKHFLGLRCYLFVSPNSRALLFALLITALFFLIEVLRDCFFYWFVGFGEVKILYF